MTNERYLEIERDGGYLTVEEALDGWHFCWEWDGLLVGPGMDEMEACICAC